MKSAKSLCVVFLLILGPSRSVASAPANTIEVWANGQFIDYQFTLPNGTKGGIDPVTRKEVPGKIGYDNSYLGDITGETNDPSRSSANFSILRTAEFGRYELLFFQKANQKSPKTRDINVYFDAAYYSEGVGKNKPRLTLEKEAKIKIPVNELCKVDIDYKLDQATKALSIEFSSPCLVK